MLRKSCDEILETGEPVLLQNYHTFGHNIADGLSDPDNILSIDEMETMLTDSINSTKNVYLTSLGDFLSNVDESALIKSKKASI